MGKDDDIPGLDPQALARAEQALSKLAEDYLHWADADLLRLEAGLTEVLSAPTEECVGRLFAVSHDIKGQAATFGYDLLGELAARLCRLLRTDRRRGPRDLARIRRLVQAMSEIISRRLSGDGGPERKRLLGA